MDGCVAPHLVQLRGPHMVLLLVQLFMLLLALRAGAVMGYAQVHDGWLECKHCIQTCLAELQWIRLRAHSKALPQLAVSVQYMACSAADVWGRPRFSDCSLPA